jgi:hypothetical protein
MCDIIYLQARVRPANWEDESDSLVADLMGGELLIHPKGVTHLCMTHAISRGLPRFVPTGNIDARTIQLRYISHLALNSHCLIFWLDKEVARRCFGLIVLDYLRMDSYNIGVCDCNGLAFDHCQSSSLSDSSHNVLI